MPHIPILEHPPSRLQQRDGSGQRARTQEDRALLVINTRVCFPLLLQARLVPSLGEHRTTLRHVRVQDLAEVSRVVIQALDGGAVQCGRKLLLVLRLEFDDVDDPVVEVPDLDGNCAGLEVFDASASG